VADVKRTSVNLDPSIVADARIAMLEAERLGIGSPRNLSAMVNEALRRMTLSLREEIELARQEASKASSGSKTHAKPAGSHPR
jgi:hypothetical protein